MSRWIACLIILLAAFVQRHAGLTSHSLRHHGAPYRPLEEGESKPELVVRLHEEVVLACDSNAQLTWKHNGKTVQRNSIYHLSSDTLRIFRVGPQEEGPWQCEERDSKTKDLIATRAVWIVIMDAPKGSYLTAEGKGRIGPWLGVKENAGLRVRCVVEGGRPPPSSFDWWIETPDGEQDSLANFSTGNELQLDKINRQLHNCTLTCSASHVALPAPINASTKLNVTYSPSFVMSRWPGFGFPLYEGMAVSLKCDVDSNPPATHRWMKDDGDPPVPQTKDGYLNFTAISREHIGWYKCSAEHVLGTFASSGYYLNVRYDEILTKQPPRQIEVALGGGVTLECGASGLSTSGPNCWGRLSGNRLEAVGAGPQLRLDSVLYQEAGAYRCVAPAKPDPLLVERKAMLPSPPDIEVVVTGQPVVYPIMRNLTAVGGSQLSLSVEFCANPEATHTFWLTQTVVLRPGQEGGGYIAQNVTEGDSAHCRRAALTIPEVLPEHAGEYLFIVRSPRGMADGAVRLNVSRGSYTPKRTWSSPVVIVAAAPPARPVQEEAAAAVVPPRDVHDEPPPKVSVAPASSGGGRIVATSLVLFTTRLLQLV
ncbi:hemicentin-2-like [Neocloeon triangulifer]|uniref:hemicentin-2-like n=1 Tax=Neocloeon triangulifer TaxID=2078957 RepID=UPI00286ED9F6|nr:hemicentin-2-like [Neocloeon triangulifer]